MYNRIKKTLAVALTLGLMVNILGFANAASVGLETTTYTPQEMQDIIATNQAISNFLDNRPQTRASDKKILPMTAIKQENNYFCGPATACMIAKTLGLGNYTQTEMKGILKTTTDGTSSDQMANGLNSLLQSAKMPGRYQKTDTGKSNFTNSIVYSINNGYPVIVNVKVMPGYSVTVGHFIAVNGYYVGFSGTSPIREDLYICDPHPSFYGSYTYTIDEIKTACNSAVGNFCRLA